MRRFRLPIFCKLTLDEEGVFTSLEFVTLCVAEFLRLFFNLI